MMDGSLHRRLANRSSAARWVALLVLAAACPVVSARTLLDSSPAQQDKAVSAHFHREFDGASLKPDERIVVLIAATDGVVVSLNGHEIGRSDMPGGAVDVKTLALAPEDAKHKGLFIRMLVPPEAVHAGQKNSIDADVHSASAAGSLLSCDIVVKTLPADEPAPAPGPEARKVLEEFRRDNYIPPGTPLPDGYIDGGRHMALDSGDRATSGREILLVDRAHDPELSKDLEFARSLRNLPPMERARKLSAYVDQISTPPGGRGVLEPTVTEIEHEFANKPLRIGDLVDQCHAGVCRHRSLLFKLLADEAGLQCALVRGNFVHLHAGGSAPHAWNELKLEDGRRFLVDTTLRPNAPFPEITSPEVTSPDVAKRYVKTDKTPYYKSA